MSRRAARLAALACLAAACTRRGPPQLDPAVVALVNAEPIPVAEFTRELALAYEVPEGATAPAPDQLVALKQTVLQELVDRQLLLQEARAKGISVSPEAVRTAVAQLKAEYQDGRFQEALSLGRLSEPEFERNTAERLTVEKLVDEVVYQRVAVTEEELQGYLDSHADEFQEPEQVHAAQIVVKELEDARRLRDELHRGAKFGDLARAHSLSADARLGGDLGWFPRGVMPPEFDAVAFSLQPGQISDVVTSEYGFHLFKVLERRPARKKDLAQVRREVERRLLRDKKEQAQAAYVQTLREHASVRTNDAALAKVSGPPATPAGSTDEARP
ncbi:MAG: peptidyl-prolyl cis-trans isomerase [Myxococcaceae bacterium]